jgi:S1-C subfamily serine protease
VNRRALCSFLLTLTALLSLGRVIAQSKESSDIGALQIQIQHAISRGSKGAVAIYESAEAGSRIRTGTIVSPKFVITDSANLVGFPKTLIIVDRDGKKYTGKVLGRDWRLRLAAISLDKPLPHSLDKTREVTTGSFAIACGRGEAPTGLALATMGIISARSRFSGRTVQVSCDLNQSVSGGPIVDLEGKAYGVSILLPHQISRDSGVGFMVPWGVLERSLPALIRGKNVYPASFGLLVPDRGITGVAGIPVVDVRPGGPADNAGIEKGDLLLAIGDRPLESIHDLSTRIAQLAAGDTVTVKIRRGNGQVAAVTLTTGRRDR